MEKNLTERLYEALSVIPEFMNLCLDGQAEVVLNVEGSLANLEDFPKGEASGPQLNTYGWCTELFEERNANAESEALGAVWFMCGECLLSSMNVPICNDHEGRDHDETFICTLCGAETTYHEDGSSSSRSKENVGQPRIKVVCGKCHGFIDYKDAEDPKMDGMISDSLCASCGQDQLAELAEMRK